MEGGIKATDVYERKGIYNDDLFQIYNLAGSAALLLETQGDRHVNTARDSKSWFKKALQISGELPPEMYERNLEQLISDLPNVEGEYWIND